MLEPNKKSVAFFSLLTFGGAVLFVAGLLLWPNNPAPLAVGGLLFAVSGRFLIACVYKNRTGKDTGGVRFWKWLLNKKDQQQA